MQKTNRTRRLVRCALLAAVYTVLCLVLGYASFGPVQFRIAEALVMLPVFGPEYIVSSVLGCFLANLLGSTPIDVIFGTAATLVAAAGTWLLRNVRIRGLVIPASLPPVLVNAMIVGALELTFFVPDAAATLPAAAFNALTVGLGEIICCSVLGVSLVKLIETNPALREFFH